MFDHETDGALSESQTRAKKIEIATAFRELSTLLKADIEINIKPPTPERLASSCSLADLKMLSKMLLEKAVYQLIHSDHNDETKEKIRLLIIKLTALIDEKVENILPINE